MQGVRWEAEKCREGVQNSDFMVRSRGMHCSFSRSQMSDSSRLVYARVRLFDCVSLVVLALSVVLLICFSSDLVLADEVQVVAADDKGALHLGSADDT